MDDIDIKSSIAVCSMEATHLKYSCVEFYNLFDEELLEMYCDSLKHILSVCSAIDDKLSYIPGMNFVSKDEEIYELRNIYADTLTLFRATMSKMREVANRLNLLIYIATENQRQLIKKYYELTSYFVSIFKSRIYLLIG